MSAATVAAPIGVRGVLRIPHFRLLWLGQLVSDTGDSLTLLSLLITINLLTGSTAALALMTVVLTVPQVTIGLVAGVFVDRLDKRRIMLVADGLRGVLVLGFVVAVQTQALWLLYTIGFVQAMVGTFFTPARTALVPDIVPQPALMAANSLTQITRMIGLVVGGGAAGLMFSVFDTLWPAFVLDALTFFFSCAMIGLIRLDAQPPRTFASATAGAIFGELVEGLRLIPGSRALLGTFIGIGIGMVGFGMINIMLVPLMLNDLKVEPVWFGSIDFAQIAGMVVSGGLVGMLVARLKPTHIQSFALLALGILVGALGLAPHILFLVADLFVIGFFVPPLQASAVTVIQTAGQRETRGRVVAAFSTVSSTATVLAAAVGGLFGDWIGVRNGLICGGLIVVIAGFVTAAIFAGASDA